MVLIQKALFLLLLLTPALTAAQDEATGGYDADAALAISQAAVGKNLGDLGFTDSNGNPVQLASLKGKPLLISLIFTSCYHVCPAITKHLGNAVSAARDALGADSFHVLTIGFDTANDTSEAMRTFARQQRINDPNWLFLSADDATMASLTANLGFVHFPSARGFDHINQVTMVDQGGVIYTQVYGAGFELPAMVEPLKELVFNRPRPGGHMLTGLIDRVKLFCTVYDPTTGLYRFDYSLFVQIGVGALVLLVVGGWLLMEIRRARRRRGAG